MSRPAINQQLNALNGARALSILAVLACHLVPLGPKTHFDLNIAVGQFGMAIFFALSGFLIAHKLITEESVFDFAVNRAMRIFPLLWLLLLIDFAWRIPLLDAGTVIAHFLVFVNNLPNYYFPETEHLWSVCVEIHFYILSAMFFFMFRRSGLGVLAILGIFLSFYRYQEQAVFNTSTLFRLDELLAGLAVGLLWHTDTPITRQIKKVLSTINPLLILIILGIANLAYTHPATFLLRPYLAALLIGALIYNQKTWSTKALAHVKWEWLSKHAYALYIIHPFLLVTWLASGDKLTMYAKRPALFLVLFVLAYLSTKYFERYFIEAGKKYLAERKLSKQQPALIAISKPSTTDSVIHENRAKNTV